MCDSVISIEVYFLRECPSQNRSQDGTLGDTLGYLQKIRF